MSTSRSNESSARQAASAASCPLPALVEFSPMSFSYEPVGRLSPCPKRELVHLIRDRTNRDRAMRRLMLLRHAKTENDAPSGRDQDRRLDDRGRHDAAEIGRWIGRHPPLPDLVLVSPAIRAHQTWDIAWEAMKDRGPQPQVELLAELYGADPAQLLQTIRTASTSDPQRLLV